MKPLVADTGGLLRALAQAPDGRPSWPDYQDALVQASAVIVPALILAEVDYFLRERRPAMKRLVADILDPRSRYELELPTPADLARAIATNKTMAANWEKLSFTNKKEMARSLTEAKKPETREHRLAVALAKLRA